MLLIAPIVLLAIGGFVALMVSMIGDILATRDYNSMAYSSQDALNRIEQDVRLSAQFLNTTGTTSPQQGSDNNFSGTAPFTIASNNNMLLLSVPSTDKNPVDSTRLVINYANQPNPCGTTQTSNKIMMTKIAYFIRNGSLWRRTILPPYDTNATPDNNTVCSSPWQQNSCVVGYVNDSHCQTNDAELMKNIQSLSVKYFADPTSTVDVGVAGASTATTLSATLTGLSTTGGRNASTTQSIRATKLNNPTAVSGGTSQTPLTITLQPKDTTVLATATNIIIPAGSSVSSASVLWQQSTDNGSTWQDMAGQASNTLLLSSVDMTWNNRQFRAVFTNGSDTVTTSTATLSVMSWTSLALQNSWTDFGTPYSPNGYIKTTSGVVMLKGLLKRSGSIVPGETLTSIPLPTGFRPAYRMIFQVSTSNAGRFARVDVDTNGNIYIMSGDPGYLSLEGINFMPSGTTFTSLTLGNSWVNYGSTYAPAGYATDSVGRTHIQGLVKNGVVTDGTQIITNLPAAARTGEYLHVPDYTSGAGPGYVGIDPANGVVAKGNGNANGWMNVNAMFNPASMSAGWTNLGLMNGWVPYPGYASPQFIKGSDNIVMVKGLIKSGTVADGTVIGCLPAGYWPKDRVLIQGGIANTKAVRWDIRQTDGCIEIYNGDVGWSSLDAISFVVEQ
jgi:hypothetical protein